MYLVGMSNMYIRGFQFFLTFFGISMVAIGWQNNKFSLSKMSENTIF
jgi:hypothetical protein